MRPYPQNPGDVLHIEADVQVIALFDGRRKLRELLHERIAWAIIPKQATIAEVPAAGTTDASGKPGWIRLAAARDTRDSS